jgi:membrane protease YdiL (CAAX protease family)
VIRGRLKKMILAKVFARFFPQKETSIKHGFALFSLIFVFWTIFRYFPEMVPLWAEELVFKPLIWLLPTLWLVKKIEKRGFDSLGITAKNLFPSLYWGLGLGMVFALEGFLTNILKYHGLQLITLDYTFFSFLGFLGLSFATAFSEEIVFRGYLFNRFWQVWKDEWLANLVTSLLFAVIHLPIGVFVLGYRPAAMMTYLFFIFLYSLASGFVFARTRNLASSVLLHVFWSWPILLFR